MEFGFSRAISFHLQTELIIIVDIPNKPTLTFGIPIWWRGPIRRHRIGIFETKNQK